MEDIKTEKSFLFREVYINELPPVLAGAFTKAMAMYRFRSEEPDFDKFGFTTDTEKILARQLWAVIKDNIERDLENEEIEE